MARHIVAPAIWALLACLVLHVANSAVAKQCEAGDTSTLIAALRDPSIDLIIITEDTLFVVGTPPPGDAQALSDLMMAKYGGDSGNSTVATIAGSPPVSAIYDEPTMPLYPDPITLTRNLTIQGANSTPYFRLDFLSVRGAIHLLPNIYLTFETLELDGMFGVFDIYPTTFEGSTGGWLVIQNCTDHRKVCQPLKVVQNQLLNAAWPSGSPTATDAPQNRVMIQNNTSCGKDSAGVQFCLDQSILLEDMICGPAPADNVNYVMHEINVDLLCDVFVNANGTRDPSLANSWSLDLRVVLLPTLLGAVVVGVSAALTVWALRRRHRQGKADRHRQDTKSSSTESDVETGSSRDTQLVSTNTTTTTTSDGSGSCDAVRSGGGSGAVASCYDDLLNGRDQQGGGSSGAGAPAPGCAISLGPLLGVGSFGRVYKGLWRGQVVAVKVIPHPTSAAERVQREVDIMMRCASHANVLRALHYEVFSTTSSASGSLTYGSGQGMASNMETWLVLEYCDQGCLANHLGAGLPCLASPERAVVAPSHPTELLHDMRSVVLMALDVARGMASLHSVLVCHGDLKCENVLLCSTPPSSCARVVAKVADFGLSQGIQSASHLSTTTVGTVTHMPPELLMSGQLRPSCDVYSFGILLWQLVTGAVPYKDMRYAEIVYKVAVFNMRPVFPDHIPATYQQLASDCWRVDPAARLTFEQIIQRLDAMLADVVTLQHELDHWRPPDAAKPPRQRSRVELPSPFSDVTMQSLLESQCLSEEALLGDATGLSPATVAAPATAVPAAAAAGRPAALQQQLLAGSISDPSAQASCTTMAVPGTTAGGAGPSTQGLLAGHTLERIGEFTPNYISISEPTFLPSPATPSPQTSQLTIAGGAAAAAAAAVARAPDAAPSHMHHPSQASTSPLAQQHLVFSEPIVASTATSQAMRRLAHGDAAPAAQQARAGSSGRLEALSMALPGQQSAVPPAVPPALSMALPGRQRLPAQQPTVAIDLR